MCNLLPTTAKPVSFRQSFSARHAQNHSSMRACKRSGSCCRRLLRLHHLDILAWPAAIASAVALARQGDDDASWIQYSASYSEERRVTKHDIRMHIGL